MPPTVIDAFWPMVTTAQGSIETTAAPVTLMLLGTLWVTPLPAQVSLAAILDVCCTTVPFGLAQLVLVDTVSVADPRWLTSSLLVAVIV